MGNSNSTSGGGHGHGHMRSSHHPHSGNRHSSGHHNGHHGGYEYDHGGWSHSLESPEQRNRMKRGYNNFPPHRAYINGHPGPQPQKVLPQSAVNATKLLKATSNGAILHGGGTISGRKLSEMELDARKRSTASCPATNSNTDVENHLIHSSNAIGLGSGRSTPNLLRPRMGISGGGGHGHGPASSKGSSKSRSGRDYGSEPDLRDVGVGQHQQHFECFDDGSPDRSVSPLPNSFTLISESPAKKQIRSRKKSKAPAPPPGHEPMPMGMMTAIPYNMNMVQHQQPIIPYQYQLQQNPQRQLLLTPVLHHGDELHQGGSSNSKKKLRLFKTKAESKSGSGAPSPALRSPSSSELNHPGNNNFIPAPIHMSNVNVNVIRGGPMRASLDPNRLIRGERERISVHSIEGNNNKGCGIGINSGYSSSHPIDRESKVGSKEARLKPTAPLCSPNSGKMLELTKSSNKISSHAQNKSLNVQQIVPSSCARDVKLENQKTTSNNSSGLQNVNKVPKNIKTNLEKTDREVQVQKKNAPLIPSSSYSSPLAKTMVMEADEKKTFYFGMDMGTFSHKMRAQLQKDKANKSSGQREIQQEIQIQKERERPESSTSSYGGGGGHGNGPTNDIHKEISRRKMLQKLDNELPPNNKDKTNNHSSPSPGNPNEHAQPHNNNSRPKNNHGNLIEMSHPQKKNNAPKQQLHKSNSNNIRSESDSDGIHRRQDSGSFDINDNLSRKKALTSGVKGKGGGGPPIRESSSDLSSSDVDVPLVVTRPTLPQKRPDLPRFSPTAAWRAIDSPSRISARSYDDSSEEFRHHNNNSDNRIHRYTRPSAPPRISHERSGDSGISAGDAGSPANPIPLEEEDGPLLLETMNEGPIDSSSSPNQLRSRHLNGKMIRNGGRIQSADRMMKCWTPEQDLDESSSEFETDHDPPILPPSIPPKPISGKNSNSKCNLFEGKRAAAVVSDSDSKYFGGATTTASINSNGAYYSDEFSSSRRFHNRSNKSKQQNMNSSSSDGIPNKKRNNAQNQRINNNINTRQHLKFNKNPNHSPIHNNNNNNNGFVGLDANWFLSRSEPNSLNYMGISTSYSELPISSFKMNNNANVNYPRGKKGSDREVIIGSSRKNGRTATTTTTLHHDHLHHEDDDELECELHLGDEEESASDPPPAPCNNNSGKIQKAIKTGRSRWNVGVGSTDEEIGYGPSNMSLNNNSYEDQEEGIIVQDETQTEDEIEEELMRDDLFDYLDQYEEGEFEREQELSSDNLLTAPNLPQMTTTISNNQNQNDKNTNNRPFSHHIMYLPSYDARKIHQNNQHHNGNWRRTRSVDHLDSSEVTLFKRSNGNGNSNGNRHERIIPIRMEDSNELPGNNVSRNNHQAINRKSSVPSYFPEGNSKNEVQILHKRINTTNIEVKHSEVTPNPKPMTPNSRMTHVEEDEEERRRALNKKKFKFQSTLRVQERRKIEEELSREAQHAEEERLREIEAMKRVEEEFQKKRAKERQEAEEAAAAAAAAKLNKSPAKNKNKIEELSNFKITSASASGASPSPRIISSAAKTKPSPNSRNSSSQQSIQNQNHPGKVNLSHQVSSSSAGSSNINLNTRMVMNQNHQYKNHQNDGERDRRYGHGHSVDNGHGGHHGQRQEPEGAPASASICNSSNGSTTGSTTTDLRKELITASKKRSGNLSSGINSRNSGNGHGHSNGGSNVNELTQELSEFRQETRQYCDYRRAPRQQSLSPARFVQKSSSSDIFPISSRRKAGSSYSGTSKTSGRSTIHPEVVCDIPVKPVPYMVNASRLSNSHMNLVSEERQSSSSVLGSLNNLSTTNPSLSPSILSDNYRKGWLHNHRGPSSNLQQGGRASSVISLHSGHGYSSSDNFRNSTSDLSRVQSHSIHPNGNMSPRFIQERSNRLGRQYSASPPTSASPLPHSSNESTGGNDHFQNEKYTNSRASPVRISSRSNTTVISIGAPLPSSFHQAQPYNRVKNYRPVPFKPSSTTAVN